MSFEVHKYGGSSLANASGFLRVSAAIGRPKPHRVLVVVSAPSGVTDAIIQLFEQGEGIQSLAGRLRQLSNDLGLTLETYWDQEFQKLNLAVCEGERADAWLSRGEYWSAHLLHCLLQQQGVAAKLLDSAELIWLDDQGRVDWTSTSDAVTAAISGPQQLWLAQGYVASSPQGARRTLGRNGSDYSASIVAAVLKATKLAIWSDTDGVLTADPDQIPHAERIPEISYSALDRLARLGTGVVHPQSVRPVMDRGIPLSLGNSYRPNGFGSVVRADAHQEKPVITALTDLGLIRIKQPVNDVPDLVLGVVQQGDHLELLVKRADADAVLETVAQAGGYMDLNAARSAVFAVGRVDISVLEAALRSKGFHGLVSHQGETESWVSVLGDHAQVLVSLAHECLVEPDHLQVLVLGDGATAASLLEGFTLYQQRYERLPFRLLGVIGDRESAFEPQGMDPDEWEPYEHHQTVTQWVRRAQIVGGRHKVLVDTRDNATVAEYVGWLEQGFDLVTANMAPLAGKWSDYEQLLRVQQRHQVRVYTEGTGAVGVLNRLRSLLDTGDSIHSIRGVLCGFHSWLWSRLLKGEQFSDLIMEARETGLLDPSSSETVRGFGALQRWILIARMCGFQAMNHHIRFKPFDLESFGPFGSMMDSRIQRFVEHAVERGCRPTMLGSLASDGQIELSIEEIPESDPVSRAAPGDVYLELRTQRLPSPIILAGPGLGPDATAAGLMLDIVNLLEKRGLSQECGPLGGSDERFNVPFELDSCAF
ncbi:MAG: hypothetical protein KDC35_09450 [Acidobacteria bacterium]|nr:hypothetical protein [Acidobacteriota bacterium]